VKEGEDGNRKKLMENEKLCAHIGQIDWRERAQVRGSITAPQTVVSEPVMLIRNFESDITGDLHLKIHR